jgi:hypothetical protein
MAGSPFFALIHRVVACRSAETVENKVSKPLGQHRRGYMPSAS